MLTQFNGDLSSNTGVLSCGLLAGQNQCMHAVYLGTCACVFSCACVCIHTFVCVCVCVCVLLSLNTLSQAH